MCFPFKLTLFFCLSASIPLTGCASPHLNYNTLEISATIGDVYTKETLNNISKFIDNKFAIPSQTLLNGGTIQTTDTLQPNVTFPLAPMSALATASAPTGVTRTGTGTLAGAGSSVQGSFTQQQNYTIAPLSDSNTIRNQQAIYRYAVWGIPIADSFTPPRVFFENTFYFDPYYLQLPQCVLCDHTLRFDRVQTTKNLKVNPKLQRKWVLWDIDSSPDLVDLGHYGLHELFVRKSDYDRGVLSDLVLFTLSFTVPSEVIAQRVNSQASVVLNPQKSPQNPGLRPPAQTPFFIQPFAPAQTVIIPQASGQPATNQQFAPPDRQSTFTPQGILPPP